MEAEANTVLLNDNFILIEFYLNSLDPSKIDYFTCMFKPAINIYMGMDIVFHL